MTTRLERAWKKWDFEEETFLLKRIKEGAKIPMIAAECGRTKGAIQSRLKLIACRLVANGRPYISAAKITGLTLKTMISMLGQEEGLIYRKNNGHVV